MNLVQPSHTVHVWVSAPISLLRLNATLLPKSDSSFPQQCKIPLCSISATIFLYRHLFQHHHVTAPLLGSSDIEHYLSLALYTPASSAFCLVVFFSLLLSLSADAFDKKPGPPSSPFPSQTSSTAALRPSLLGISWHVRLRLVRGQPATVSVSVIRWADSDAVVPFFPTGNVGWIMRIG